MVFSFQKTIETFKPLKIYQLLLKWGDYSNKSGELGDDQPIEDDYWVEDE